MKNTVILSQAFLLVFMWFSNGFAAIITTHYEREIRATIADGGSFQQVEKDEFSGDGQWGPVEVSIANNDPYYYARAYQDSTISQNGDSLAVVAYGIADSEDSIAMATSADSYLRLYFTVTDDFADYVLDYWLRGISIASLKGPDGFVFFEEQTYYPQNQIQGLLTPGDYEFILESVSLEGYMLDEEGAFEVDFEVSQASVRPRTRNHAPTRHRPCRPCWIRKKIF